MAPIEEPRAKRKRIQDVIVGRIAVAIVSGLILGGVFVFFRRGSATRLVGRANSWMS